MGFSCGIVGLPNVGKSTLFNALTQTSAAQAENYPFCTIEPNLAEVAVPDPRLTKLADIEKSKQTIPTTIKFVDIAGLVRGAAKGEGLGNQFLSHIRETDALLHIVRCFDDDDIVHVEGKINPTADIELIETELALADMESLEKRKYNLEKKARGQDKEAKEMLLLAERGLQALHDGQNLQQMPELAPLQLISAKKQLYVANVAEKDINGNAYTKALAALAKKRKASVMIIAASTEAELVALSATERQEYLSSLNLEEAGLHRLIRAGYGLLGLITFFTAGEKEARAWTIAQGTAAPQAAARIHTDFEKKFIRAEVIDYNDFTEFSGAANAAKSGKMRLEGKDYIVRDGDVIYFRTGS